MRFFEPSAYSLGILARRQSIWVVLLAAGLLAGTAFGQGPINVSETGLHDANSVYGIDGSAFSTPWINSQIITLLGWGETDPNLYSDVSFSAYGIFSGANLTNQAAIDVNGVGGSAFGIEGDALAFVQAYGIFGNPDGDVVVSNSGNITVVALGGTSESNGGTANSQASAYGISANHTLTNSGGINVSATGGTAQVPGFGSATAYARAYGLYTNGDVINSGDVTTAATGGTASSGESIYAGAQAYAESFGIYAYSGVNNTAGISVSATGGNVSSEVGSTYAGASAYGIYNFSETVDNSGDITVTATGAEDTEDVSTNAAAYGIRASGIVINSGDINVTAEAGDGSESQAYGIYLTMEGYGEGPDNEITNTGTIRAFGDSAYELYIVSGTTQIVNTYNVTLDGDPANPSIGVDNGATLDLNNAVLTVTDVQGDVDGATQLDTEYRLFGVAGEGAVTGNFSSVDAINPDLTAHYYTLGTANAADDTVALSYAPQVSEALASASVERRVVAMSPYALNQHMTMDLMYDTLALDEVDQESEGDATGDTAQGLTACQRSGGAFFQPNYSFVEKDHEPLGYEAGMSGVSGGYSQCVNSSLLGLHVGYSSANIDYTGAGYSANTEDQDVVTSGFSGMTRFRPWIFRYGFTGFRGWHDYSGLTGVGLTESETAEFDSYGGTGLLMVGRTFKHKKHVFLPEIGANWLWVHRESYTTEATDAAWDTTYSTLNDHDVWAQAALHWQSLYKYKKIQITPSASLGVHQLLTDGETEISQSLPGAARVEIEDEQDETAVSLASAVVLRGRRTALTLAYDGEYSSDIEQHNFWMKFRLRF